MDQILCISIVAQFGSIFSVLVWKVGLIECDFYGTYLDARVSKREYINNKSSQMIAKIPILIGAVM